MLLCKELEATYQIFAPPTDDLRAALAARPPLSGEAQEPLQGRRPRQRQRCRQGEEDYLPQYDRHKKYFIARK